MHIRSLAKITQVIRENFWGLAFKNLSRLASLQGHHRLGKLLKSVLLRNRPDGKYGEYDGAVYEKHCAPKPKENFPEEPRHIRQPAMD
jgi:hypothetical protein